MCGIAGIFIADRHQRVSSEILDRMVDALAHRGPDDRGTTIDGPIGIGMRRLSIIDVQGGHQPMSNHDGDIHVVYNGECYNHEELRRDLEHAGHHFRTHCDTEVVLHGYQAWGIRGLCERMNGIYAFCVWDGRKRKAYLCRDRLGVKPVYYADRGGRFAFASELRSVCFSGLVQAKIDETALWGYLAYQFTPTDRTLISGVTKLPPGHFLEWDHGKVAVHQYWDFPNRGEDQTAQLEERTEALRTLLWDTVGRQMMSDVPIGCFLSGGLDSTIIACMMAKRSGQPIRTFSIAFPDNPDCDESEYFEQTATQLGAQHRTISFSEQAILDTLDDFSWAMDEPVADPAMLPTYLLSRAAAQEVKVVLTGEGADEVFAGYPYYRPFVLGGGGTSSAQEVVRHRHWLAFSRSLSDRVGETLPGPRNDLLSPISNFPYSLDPRFIWNLLHPDRRPAPERMDGLTGRIERSAVSALTATSPLQTALALDTKLWLANDLMPKLDKMTMAHSLEGRVPFLDHRVVEFAHALPGRFKIGPEHGKLILRDAVRGVIPDAMLHRVKHGFNVPLYEWFRGSLRGFAREAVLGPTLAETGLFHRKGLEALLAAHIEMNVNVARPLWSLICLSRWFDRLQKEMARIGGDAGESNTAPTRLPERDERPTRRREPAVSGRPLKADTVPARCDIIVPVYEGVNYVRDLLRSLRRNTPYPHRVILMDDSCNDRTHDELQRLAADDPRIELQRNEENVGFVVTCNRGMARSRSAYVCLLNTDVMVTPGWLSAMVRCAESDPLIAIVNPLSNMCVNLSVPMAPGLNMNTMAFQVERRSRRRYPDITTAVGFCMLVKRCHLDRLGAFDEVYGQGYCEESDMCMRYTEAGLRVVAADDAFVYHKGCGSFGTWIERYEANRKVFDARWEEAYLRDYRHFLRANPLQYVRDAVLRHTIHKADWSTPAAMAMERAVGRRGRRLSAPTMTNGDGSVAPREVEGPSLPSKGRTHAIHRAMRRPRTRLDPTERDVRYPIRPYVDGLPMAGTGGASSGRDSALRITFLMGRDMPICGGVTSVVQLAREMTLAGHDVKLATECEELQPERFNLPCQPIVYPNKNELIRLFPPSDVVLATFWTTAHDYLPALRARYDFVSAYFVQDYEVYFYPPDDLDNRRKAAESYGAAEHRIVKSKWLKTLIERNHGVSCDLVHLGLDLGIFRPRSTSDRLRQPPRIITVARPKDERRGFREVVDVFRRLHAARPDATFVFFGTPDEEMPTDLPFPCQNAGRLEDLNKVAELVASCDILVDSSLFQGFGRPGIEAMACGTACVLTSEGGMHEYTRHEENCLLVSPGDNEAMVASLLRLLREDALRTRLCEAGLETAKRFCHVDEARQHLQLYQKWVQAKSESPRAEQVARLAGA